jgi:hypothetical protein
MLKKVGLFGFSNASTGGHSARSMMFLELRILVRAMPLNATKDDFTKTIVEENVLEKPTLSSRKKSLRHLIELYGMDPSETLFRVLWQLGHADLLSPAALCRQWCHSLCKSNSTSARLAWTVPSPRRRSPP